MSKGHRQRASIAVPLLLGSACSAWGIRNEVREDQMAEGVHRIVDVVGVSEKSWEDAGRNAVETAAGSLRDLRVAEVVKLDMKVENGKVVAFRTRVALSFKYES
jgi:flavin-binding protein dodecin